MKFETARLAMVESQIRPNGVRDPRILNAMATLPRELFVPARQRPFAYMDGPVPAVPAEAGSPARYLLAPMTLARLLEAACVRDGDRALDVGGATGYSAALLVRLGAKVDALEANQSLAKAMKEHLAAEGIEGTGVHAGPLNEGFPAGKPFDVILINGGVTGEPETLLDQLADGGRLVTVMRKGWFGQGYLFTKSAGVVSGRPLFDASAEILPGFEAKPQFVF